MIKKEREQKFTREKRHWILFEEIDSKILLLKFEDIFP